MTKESWSIWASNPRGERFRFLDFASRFRVLQALNAPGYFEIALPLDIIQKRDDELELFLRLDGIFEFRRKAPGGANTVHVISGLARSFHFANNNLIIGGPGLNELLARRIVAYKSQSAEALKTAEADDMMKEIVSENMGSDATDTARDLSAYGFTVQGDVTAGPSITMALAYDNVLRALQAVATTAEEAGTKVFFEMVRKDTRGTMQVEFQTFIDQRGADRTLDNTAPLVFAEEWGNLSDPHYTLAYGNEVNYVYGGGRGEADTREVVEVSDSERINASPWNRREAFINVSGQASTTAGYTEIANEYLTEGKPRYRFSGQLQETEYWRYGEDWFFGDKVSAVYRKRQFDGIIDRVDLTVSGQGHETISAGLRIENVIQ